MRAVFADERGAGALAGVLVGASGERKPANAGPGSAPIKSGSG